MDNNKVSIIVPVYNQERYLNKSINSIINQSYKNIEIVAVNDGSTDNSLQMLYQYKKYDNRIIIIDKPNGGLIDAVGQGIRSATGDYVAFVDPDDYVGPNFIAKLMALFDDDVDITAAGLYAEEVSDGRTAGRRTIYLDRDEKYSKSKLDELKEDFFWDKRKAVSIFPIFQSRCNKIYNRRILSRIVDEYQSYRGADVGEDTIFNYLALRYARGVNAIKEPTEYYYCLRSEASMTRDINYIKRYDKNKNTLVAFKKVLSNHKSSYDMAYELFYLQMQVVMYQASHDSKGYLNLQKSMRREEYYKDAYTVVIGNATGIKKIYMFWKALCETKAPVRLALRLRNVRTIAGKIRNRNWKDNNK